MSALLSLTDADVQEICRIWQARLRLQDWDIHCQLVRGFRLTEAVAEVETSDTKRTAWIRVMNPADYHPDFLLPYDPERSVVHELLHVLLRPITQEAETLAEEQLVHQLSGTLVSLYRSRPDLAPQSSPALVNPSLSLLGVTPHETKTIAVSGNQPLSVAPEQQQTHTAA